MIKKGAALNDQFEEVQLMFMRLRDVVGAELFPVFKELLTQLTEIFIANKPAIIAFGKAFAENLPSTLKTIAGLFQAIWMVVKPVLFIFEQLSHVFGAANLIFGILAVTIVGKLIFAIYALGGALIQLGLIAATTPIGLIALGIGLVIAAIAALIVYWQPIKAFFLGLWDIFSRSPIALLLGPLGILVLLGRQLYDNWQPFSDLISGIAAKISAVGGAVSGFLGIGGGRPQEAFGPPSGAGAVTQGVRNVPGALNRTENQITIDLNGAPPGTRIKTEKAEAPLDFNMGFGMSTA
jgi:hypothetical protein